MIRLVDLTKTFFVDGRPTTVVDAANLTIPSGVSVGLLGRNGAGKSTLMQIISGTMRPTSGRVETTGRISWPVGFRGGYHSDLTGAQNARFVARIYGRDTEELIAFVDDFAELGPHLYQPLRTYSQGMRARLAFGISMGIPFDTYLIDEVMSVGDRSFRAKSQALMRDRLEKSGAIIVNHSTNALRRNCEAGIVLEKGKLFYFDDIEDAIAIHDQILDAG